MRSRSLTTYYARRGAEYESIYQIPERQGDLRQLESLAPQPFHGLDVLEIACGTGYWTQCIARSARRIVAVDYSPEVLEIARKKTYGDCDVSFRESDVYALSNVDGEYPAAFCGFWWSHVPKENRIDFLNIFHSKLRQNAVVLLMENMYVEGSSTPISRTDDNGNTYQQRKLNDGSTYEVLKNFTTENELKEVFADQATAIQYQALKHYWLLKYRVRK